MPVEVTISNDVLNKGNWLHVHIPPGIQKVTEATLQSREGTVIKRVNLHEGHNMIDLSHVNEPVVHLKIDTIFETICKEIKLNPQ